MPTIEVMTGDITTVQVDAIVNAANSGLLGGSGVDGAIHAAGGPEILEACKQIRDTHGTCATGEAVVTTAGRLDARWVIHTVGPIWRGGDNGEPALLRRCYRRSMELAAEHDAGSVAFPAISTGVYGYPILPATQIAISEVRAAQTALADRAPDVLFVCFSDADRAVYDQVMTGPAS